MPKPKSSFHNFVVKVNGKNSCKLCGTKLCTNFTRNKKHFLTKCRALPNLPPDLEESVLPSLIDIHLMGSDHSNDGLSAPKLEPNVNPGNAMAAAATPLAPGYGSDQVFEPNVTTYSGSSGYQNTPAISSRIQSAPNGSSQRLLPKGGKHRNANILSAVLCLIKELDYASLEVVDTTIHCRMEEMED